MTIISIAFSCVLLPVLIVGQTRLKPVDCIPGKLPSTLKLYEPRPAKYKVTTGYFNQDIFGNFFNKTEVSGMYTRGLAGGKAKWNNVRIADSDKKEGAFPEGALQTYMDNLQYVDSTAATDTLIFKNFPAGNIYSKTLIWDMFTFESFAWRHFDSLKLNIPYNAGSFNTTVSLSGEGEFINQDVKLTWTGISRMNEKQCALIQFEAMGNLSKIKIGSMSARGRSHYWGNIWVSLEDKQIEKAVMNEDVIMEVDFAGNNRVINTVRIIKAEKAKD